MLIYLVIITSMAPDNDCGDTLNIDVQCRFNLTSPESIEEALRYLTLNYPNSQKDKICVVSVIGKSSFSSNGCKASLLDDQLLGRNVFRGNFISQRKLKNDSLFEVEGFFDSRNHVIFLHMLSHMDTDILMEITRELEKRLLTEDFLQVYSDIAFNTAKVLLLLFIISHVVIIVTPIPHFDLNYLQLFRLLDNARLKTSPIISELLKDFPRLADDWVYSGRPCSPRVLFVFEAYRNSSAINKSKIKYEQQLADQIYRILRKSHIITNICADSLFAISTQQDYVFVSTNDTTIRDSQDFFFNLLKKFCTSSEKSGKAAPAKCDVETRDKSFYSFLWPHINMALTKGFDDNIGFCNRGPVFELPVVEDFFLILKCLSHNFFTNPSKETSSAFNHIKNSLNIDTKFSENRCIKLLPMALSIYQEGLPPHYTSDYHEQKVAQALHYFIVQSRGPAINDFLPRLRQECDAFWKNGRRMCDVLSLTGNNCLNPLHRTKNDEIEGILLKADDSLYNDSSKLLPVLSHCSGVKVTSACDCGKRQAVREDPFSVKVANYNFYQTMSSKCSCGRAERRTFPIFQPSSENSKPADLVKLMEKLDHMNISINMSDFTSQPELHKASLSDISPKSTPNNAVNRSERHYTSQKYSELNGHDEVNKITNSKAGKDDKSTANKKNASTSTESEGDNWESDEENLDKLKQIQLVIREQNRSPHVSVSNTHSTTEYLPGMLHTLSPPDLLPRYSSWSLVCLGSSCLYSHNIGVEDQPGFLPGTNFLLPWDVTVKLEHSGQHLPLWEGKRPPGIKNKKVLKDGTQFTVKIFLGVEYECPKGHRFMSSKPGIILKASEETVRDNANEIATNDMPLYIQCLCSRPGKEYLGQLMRLHVVTPKAPVHVNLNPRVQPATSAPIFYPGNSEPIKLSQAAYWVLRFPFVYEGDQGVYAPFKDDIKGSFLLKNTYGISNYISTAKK